MILYSSEEGEEGMCVGDNRFFTMNYRSEHKDVFHVKT